ncbi:MAG: RNA polymerase sigma-70 factor (ECF subfamily) [Planctomycetota bacterium]|jgi:RNA polymerase sigma-70 factor (ECF subfamily)
MSSHSFPMNSITQWTADARNGDQAALTRLYEVTHGPLLQRIRLMMGRGPRREVDSMDLLQDVQVRVLGAIDQFDDSGGRIGLMRWMTTIARNRLCDLGRRNRADALDSFSVVLAGVADDKGDSPSAQLHRDETWIIVMEAMEQLDPDYREVIALRSLDGLDFLEVAQAMDRSEGAVRTLYARALMRIGSALKQSKINGQA